ncbi:MAG: AMMECR1 domain-containing protein [Sulfurimonas sp.]|jgi:AMMECR1 domain-containing protein|nr:AMMECR1 domain-containing protein [Sulfurimonas sp.]MBU1216507.1 AMMECR1 domain-containing protein [bacterium]MBU1433516.1 AMMECR1 domain-containing protein [bacterium]MBU1503302.1 AMMECR1 domain-containing protein [bacterium]MBU3938369.1 AMMECR1 domain-containing protein [bacterium]
MSRSVLLQLARDSIAEVLEAQRTIDRSALLEEHPLLAEPIFSTVNLYLDKKLRGSSSSDDSCPSLLEGIVKNAKKAAFEDKNFTPISTSEYLDCEVEILLDTPDGVISQRDKSIISDKKTPKL